MSDNALVNVAPRYQRSVQIHRDFYGVRDSLRGYQVTPLVRETGKRILAGLDNESTARAFSIIGPYGSGKSAFGLFLVDYLQQTPRKRKHLLRDLDADNAVNMLSPEAPRLLPVVVGGNNSSLRYELLIALRAILLAHRPAGADAQQLLAELEQAFTSNNLDPQCVADLFARAAACIVHKGEFAGLLLVIDELGQYLHYAAREDDERDLFVLQSLAEVAARSGSTPLLIVTILHQAFERYTVHAGATRRVEWSKVQGRFIDLPFQEPASQMIRMIAQALRPTGIDQFAQVRVTWAAQVAIVTEELGLRPTDIDGIAWQHILAHAYPIHPTVLVALPQLFRQLAQNERSLFAFLHADEPFGLRDLIRSGTAHMPIYRLTHLFAYVEAVLGPGLFGRAHGRRWAELAEARAVLGGALPLEQDVLTVIGTLGTLGQTHGLRASDAQVTFALTDRVYDDATTDALLALQRRKAIVYRQHRGSYVVWEGSDLDLDGMITDARRLIGDRASLAGLMQRYVGSPPVVARQHSYRTGATRMFTVRYIDAAHVQESLTLSDDAEGELLYIVPADADQLDMARAWAMNPARADEPQRVVILPRRVREVLDLLLDVAALQEVLEERPELENDRVARREVASRLLEARQALAHTLGEAFGAGRSVWFHCGHGTVVETPRQIDALLSAALDETYHASPRIWNELIVRRQLSSAAAKARRNLVEAMLDHQNEEYVGITSYPPERAIYASVLQTSGLHRSDNDGTWRILAPPDHDPLNLLPTWQAIETFLEQAQQEPVSVINLYSHIEAPPYGVKPGVSPLLFIAFYLSCGGEIILFERGNYAPIPDIALFERLLARPEHFAVRRARVDGARRSVYEHLARTFAPRALLQPIQPALLTAVLPLLRTARNLPDYTIATKTLNEQTQHIRTALREARSPDELIFERLPLACGMSPFSTNEAETDEVQISAFFTALRAGLEDLQGAYGALLTRICECLCNTFRTTGSDSTTIQSELSERYYLIADTTNDPQIRSLGIRLETADNAEACIESIAAFIAKRPLAKWTDDDLPAFEMMTAELGRRFIAVEQMVTAVQPHTLSSFVVRVGIVNQNGETSRVVSRQQHSQQMEQLYTALQAVLDQYADLSDDERTAVIADLLKPLLAPKVTMDCE